jgi:phage terminase small subunit
VDARRRLFVKEYFVDLESSKAAKRAGFSTAMGRKLLMEPEVHAEVERQLALRERAIEVTADRALAEIGAIAFSDIRKVFRPDGSLLPPADFPDDMAGAISSVEVDELFEWQPREDGGRGKEKVQVGFTKKLKLWDKPAALTMLGKHFKLWADQVEVTVNAMSEEERLLRVEALIVAGLARAREKAMLRGEVDVSPEEAEAEDG